MILNKRDIHNTDVSQLKSWCHACDRPNVDSNREHYKLLTYLSLQYNNITFGDVGMRFGTSAYAMSANPTNKVKTFEMNKDYTANFEGHNIEVIYKDVLEEPELLLDCYIVLIDIDPHDGYKERMLFTNLDEMGWKGIVLFDDIGPYWPDLQKFWQDLPFTKYDITEYGHFSGTGLINFSDEEIVLE